MLGVGGCFGTGFRTGAGGDKLEARKAEISNRTFGRLRQPWRKEQREMAASRLRACCGLVVRREGAQRDRGGRRPIGSAAMGCVLPWITPWGTCRRLGQRRAASRTGEACTAARGVVDVVVVGGVCPGVVALSARVGRFQRSWWCDGGKRQAALACEEGSECLLSGLCWARIDCHYRLAGPAVRPSRAALCLWSRNLAGCIVVLAVLSRASSHCRRRTSFLSSWKYICLLYPHRWALAFGGRALSDSGSSNTDVAAISVPALRILRPRCAGAMSLI